MTEDYSAYTKQDFLDDANRAQSTEITCAFLSHNTVSITDLPRVITEIFAAVAARLPLVVAVAEPDPPKPAVSIRASIQPDHLTCLHCGKRFKSLKRHLMAHHNQTPTQYRELWVLPVDYPMVAPTYSTTRSALAKQSGLGRKMPPKGKR